MSIYSTSERRMQRHIKVVVIALIQLNIGLVVWAGVDVALGYAIIWLGGYVGSAIIETAPYYLPYNLSFTIILTWVGVGIALGCLTLG